MLDEVSKIAISEIDQMNFGITQQILAVNELVYENGHPKIEKVELDAQNKRAMVHFPIKDECIFFTVFLETEPAIKVVWTNTTDGSRVIFRVTSDTMALNEISSFIKIHPTRSWNIGDPHPNGKTNHTFSLFDFEPIPDLTGKIESKINTLLDLLEKDTEGIRKLSVLANSFIQIHWHGYNGNGMLGGFQLDQATITRLANLQLAIDLDLYADGNLLV